MKKLFLISTALLTFSLVTIGSGQIASAQSFKNQVCQGITDVTGSQCNSTSGGAVSNLLKTVINIFSIVVGFIAIIMLVISGLKFITSSGDPAKVSSARNSIIYAVVGLIVVALAQLIVRFVLTKTKVCPAGQTLNSQGVCV